MEVFGKNLDVPEMLEYNMVLELKQLVGVAAVQRIGEGVAVIQQAFAYILQDVGVADRIVEELAVVVALVMVVIILVSLAVFDHEWLLVEFVVVDKLALFVVAYL